MTVQAYSTKSKKLPGTNYSEVYKKAFRLFAQIKRRSKRRPYIRSAYFKKDKIFLGLFWHHLHEKFSLNDRTRRLKYFPCALELIQKTRFDPTSKENPNTKSEILHRFTGTTAEKEIFFVQIKEDKKTGEKYLISIFPFNI